MSSLRGPFLWLAAVVLAASGSATAQGDWRPVFTESFGDEAHPQYVMAGVISFGQQPDTPFVASLDEDGLVLDNQTNPSVIRYYFVEPRHAGPWEQAGGAPVAASVSIRGNYGEAPGAGLVYGVEPASHRFYAFVLTGGQGYGIFALDEQGFRPIVTGESPHVSSDGTNELIVLPDGSRLHFVVNGELIDTLDRSAHQGGPNGNGMGILVAGTGRWVFDDFEVHLR